MHDMITPILRFKSTTYGSTSNYALLCRKFRKITLHEQLFGEQSIAPLEMAVICFEAMGYQVRIIFSQYLCGAACILRNGSAFNYQHVVIYAHLLMTE